MPLEVTAGDVMQIPIALVNSTPQSLGGSIDLSISGPGLKLKDTSVSFKLSPQERSRKVTEISVTDQPSTSTLTVGATCGDISDTVTRETRV